MTMTVIVDDADPDIQYYRSALVQAGSIPAPAVNNSTLLENAIGNTLHNISGSTVAGFTYRFTGTEVGVYALFPPGPALVIPYTWSCFVDENETPPSLIQARFTPTIIKICSEDNLSTEKHQITLTALTNTTIILFDYIEYLPSSVTNSLYPYFGISADDASVTYNGQNVSVQADDGTLGFCIINYYQISEALINITFPFQGSSITAIGVVGNNFGAIGKYSIDSEPYSPFNIGSPVTGNATYAGLITDFQPGNTIFQATDFDQEKKHQLTIPGSFSTWGIQTFVISNATLLSNSSITSNSSTTSASSASSVPTSQLPGNGKGSPTSKHNTVILAVSFALLTVIAATSLIWIRWRRLQKKNTAAKHFQHLVHPFHYVTPMTSIRGILVGGMGIEIKGRRQIAQNTRRLPPLGDKRPNPRPPANTTADYSSSQQDSRDAPDSHEDTVAAVPANESANISESDALSNDNIVVRIQAEDSGIRGFEEADDDNRRRVILVPPAYTAV